MTYIERLIFARAQARADLIGGTCSNGYALRDAVPFAEWLLHVHGIGDWREIKPYKRGLLYGDYRVDCVRHGMMYENPKVYGVDFMW